MEFIKEAIGWIFVLILFIAGFYIYKSEVKKDAKDTRTDDEKADDEGI